MTLITKGMGIIKKILTKDQKKLKKILDKKKVKDLDWGDVKKSYKIFTGKPK
jgi:hypothetical protein|tara:strand:+ start:227 stop:382 length:156 start_codon:yes stop_codon:yes gene_type:complete